MIKWLFEGCFQRVAALFVFCNRKSLFKQNEDISSCLREEILTNFWSHFSSLGQGFLRSVILNKEKALRTGLSPTQPFLGSSRNSLWGGALRDDPKNACVGDYRFLKCTKRCQALFPTT